MMSPRDTLPMEEEKGADEDGADQKGVEQDGVEREGGAADSCRDLN